MSDMFATAASWLAGQRKSNLATSVVYWRGLASLEDLSATKSQPPAEVDGQHNDIEEELESADWIVTAADLILDEAATLPASGDLIKETSGGVTYTWQVTAVGGEPCFRYCDSARVSLRIHTKLISQA